MHYFSRKLWTRLNNPNPQIRMEAEKEWNEKDQAYVKQFANVRKEISRDFINAFLSRSGLHDYDFLDILFTSRSGVYCCDLKLSDGLETICVAMTGVKRTQINIQSFLHCVQGKLAWGYGEFEITPEKTIKLTVVCDEENEMLFEFESIKLVLET